MSVIVQFLVFEEAYDGGAEEKKGFIFAKF